MEKGGYGLAAGQNLDSIELADNELAEESGDSGENDSSSDEQDPIGRNDASGCEQDGLPCDESPGCNDGKPPRRGPNGKTRAKSRQSNKKRVPWSEEEKNAVYKHLGRYIYGGKPPGKRAIDPCLEKEAVLRNRNFLLVKNFCRNKIESLKNSTTGHLAE